MPRIHRAGALLALALGVAVGCNAPTPEKQASNGSAKPREVAEEKPLALTGTGAEVLQKVAEAYGSASGVTTSSKLSITENENPKPSFEVDRRLFVQGNKFHIEVKAGDITWNSISNGDSMVEYTDSEAELRFAPASLSQSNSIVTRNFEVGGSLLHHLLDGKKGLEGLLAADKLAVDKLSEKADEIVLKFTATGDFGTTTMAIDPKTYTVQKIECQMEPLVANLKDSPDLKITKLTLRETFGPTDLNAKLDNSRFAMNVPKGIQPRDMRVSGQEGSMAPAFSVDQLGGGKVTLESLKGQIVLLDFWATWCGPCRKGLPDTLEFQKAYADQGLRVVAITDETEPQVRVFLKEMNLEGLNVALDADKSASKAYKVGSLPTMILIDRSGKIAVRFDGLPPKSEILRGLERAGIDVK